MRVKICGITRLKDALDAAELGADALGFNFWPKSKRYIAPEAAAKIIAALPPFITTVGVFVNETPTALQRALDTSGIRIVQLHGDESPTYCHRVELPVIKALPVCDPGWTALAKRYDVSAILLDTPSEQFGGTGRA
ncbi:MAG: phosphoribosylanthranilate isomerase, partial [Myxococcaceae bacterium]